MDYTVYFDELGKRAKAASAVLQTLTTDTKNQLLQAIAKSLRENEGRILEANKKDMDQATTNGVPSVMLDRLLLTSQRIESIAVGVEQLIDLEDPIGTVLDSWQKENGMVIYKVRVPLGVVGMIYEARPNVTVDAATLALKTGNAIILRGGKEAFHSSKAYVDIMRDCLASLGLPQDAVQLVEVVEREAVSAFLHCRKWIDVIIPRGGAGLIKRVLEESSIPVIETGSGVVHIYVDQEASLDIAIPVIINGKVQRPSVCNAAEKLLIHKNAVPTMLKAIIDALEEHKVKLYGDNRVVSLFPHIEKAVEENWSTEYNDLIMDLKIVDSLEEAIEHINMYSTKHSEAILTENEEAAEVFMNDVDASTVYWNVSTRFTDGFEFGFGAEIGISTQKLHARGPMGLEALTSYKYKVVGHGQIRT